MNNGRLKQLESYHHSDTVFIVMIRVYNICIEFHNR